MVMYPPLFWVWTVVVGVADTLCFFGVISSESFSLFLLVVVEEGKKMV